MGRSVKCPALGRESYRRKKCPTTNASVSPIEKYWGAFPSLSFLKERMHEGRGEEKVHILWVEIWKRHIMSSKFPFPNTLNHQDNQLFIIPIFRNEIRR